MRLQKKDLQDSRLKREVLICINIVSACLLLLTLIEWQDEKLCIIRGYAILVCVFLNIVCVGGNLPIYFKTNET